MLYCIHSEMLDYGTLFFLPGTCTRGFRDSTTDKVMALPFLIPKYEATFFRLLNSSCYITKLLKFHSIQS